MSWLSELTGGIFLPLCCCTGWGSKEEGASRHAYTVANRFSAQWQNLALGLRFHCVGGWWATKRESEQGMRACQVFGLPSVFFGWALSCYFLRGYSESLWMDNLHTTEKNVWHSENGRKKKNSVHIPYQWLILNRGPYSPKSSAIYCTSHLHSVSNLSLRLEERLHQTWFIWFNTMSKYTILRDCKHLEHIVLTLVC